MRRNWKCRIGRCMLMVEKYTVTLCSRCGRCYIVGTTHNCEVRYEGTTAAPNMWLNVPGHTFTPGTSPDTTNQDFTNYYWPTYPTYWWYPYYYPYPQQEHHDYRPKCNNENCLYFKRSYSYEYGDCECKSVYINAKGKCVSFIDKYKTDAD